MDALISFDAATARARALINSNRWVEISAQINGETVLRYGALLSDGEREQAIATLTFDVHGREWKLTHA